MNYRKIVQEKWTRVEEYKEELEMPYFYLGKYLYISIQLIKTPSSVNWKKIGKPNINFSKANLEKP